MFNHVWVGTDDVPRARGFYDAVLGALGHVGSHKDGMAMYRTADGNFAAVTPRDGKAATVANGGTIAFRAKSREEVDAFHAAGLSNGGTCEGAPGVREESPTKMYGAYLRDPDGNKICAFAPGR